MGKVLTWVTEALRESHGDEKHYHDEAIARLQKEYARLQDRIDAMWTNWMGRLMETFLTGKLVNGTLSRIGLCILLSFLNRFEMIPENFESCAFELATVLCSALIAPPFH